MSKLSKNKQWDKGIRHFNRIRILTTELDADIKLAELGLASSKKSVSGEHAVRILNRQTSNSLNRIRDQINARGGNISHEWVLQVNWIRNMASHSVVWRDTFLYAPSNVNETRKALKICGIESVDENFDSLLAFRREEAMVFHELMRFFAQTLKRAIDELETQILPLLAQDPNTAWNVSGSSITLVPMHWTEYLAEMSG